MSGTVMICVREPGSEGREVARAKIARTPWSRAVGLLGRIGLSQGSGMLLWRCRAIHTAFMAFRIDAVFLDQDFRVVGVSPRVKPFSIAVGPAGTRHVLELPSGAAEEMQVTPGCSLSLL